MTLEMRDRVNREHAKAEGKAEGILGTVSSLRYFHIPDHEILLRIQEEYNLSKEEAEHYMKINV